MADLSKTKLEKVRISNEAGIWMSSIWISTVKRSRVIGALKNQTVNQMPFDFQTIQL
jgi:hypothetical protein